MLSSFSWGRKKNYVFSTWNIVWHYWHVELCSISLVLIITQYEWLECQTLTRSALHFCTKSLSQFSHQIKGKTACQTAAHRATHIEQHKRNYVQGFTSTTPKLFSLSLSLTLDAIRVLNYNRQTRRHFCSLNAKFQILQKPYDGLMLVPLRNKCHDLLMCRLRKWVSQIQKNNF